MSVVVPSILTPVRTEIEEKLGFLRGITDMVQLDIVDGRFAGPPTWPYTEGADALASLSSAEGGLHVFGRYRYEVDLMIENPEDSIGVWIDAGASRIIVHVESTRFLSKLVEGFARRYGHDKGFAPDLLSFGLAINIDTDNAILEPFIDKIDFVQFMGIAHIGKQKQPFDRRVLRKIQAFRAKHPETLIQVDGGVSLDTISDLLTAGADRFAVGSAIWKETDIAAAIQAFDVIVESHGTERGL